MTYRKGPTSLQTQPPGNGACQLGGRQKIITWYVKSRSIGYDGGVRVQAAFIAVTCVAVFLVACAAGSVESDLLGRVEGFFEAVLTGDAAALDDYISDSCREKAEFLESVGAAPAFETADVRLPEGSFSFDLGGGVVVAKRVRDSQPLLLNGEPLEDDPSNDIPLKLVEEAGVWRVENCGAYVSE